MGLSLREWLIIGGVIIVALIVLDGWRRMRGNRNTLKMNIDRSLTDLPQEGHNPELPGGGFRVIDSDGQITTVDSRKEPEFKPEPQPEALAANIADNNAGTMRAEPEFRQTGVFDSVDQQEERDPLFEPLDDFNDCSEGVSAVRIISSPDSEQAEATETEPESLADAEQVIEQNELISAEKVENVEKVEEVTDPVFDIPVISDIASEAKQQVAFDADADAYIENIQPKAAEVPPVVTAIAEDSVEDFRTPRRDSLEDDDLIASLPEDFTLFHDEVIEQEDTGDSGLDLSKPVTELMRKAQNEQPQPLQASMELVAEQVQASELVPEPVLTEEVASAPLVAEGFIRDKSDPLLGADEQETAVETFTAGRSLQEIPEPGNVLVISVVAPKSQPSFYGRSLLQILLACGMRYGDMQIFHRCEDGIDQGAIQFSMANAHEPGYFDLDKMDTFETRGVTFFMSMNEPRDVMNAYECMLATAEAVAKNLEGELLDENHSTMRTQTKEHYRERIRKFEMHKLKQQH